MLPTPSGPIPWAPTASRSSVLRERGRPLGLPRLERRRCGRFELGRDTLEENRKSLVEFATQADPT